MARRRVHVDLPALAVELEGALRNDTRLWKMLSTESKVQVSNLWRVVEGGRREGWKKCRYLYSPIFGACAKTLLKGDGEVSTSLDLIELQGASE